MLTSYSSATASDSHRLPYSTETSCQGHLVKTLCITSLSILVGFPHCQRTYSVREALFLHFTMKIAYTLDCFFEAGKPENQPLLSCTHLFAGKRWCDDCTSSLVGKDITL